MPASSRLAVAGCRRRRNPCRSPGAGRTAGFTIVELVLVIVIVGILSALAGPRFFDAPTFDARAYAEELASALRYAQKVAVGSGCRVRVAVAAAGYNLAQQAAQGGHCNPADSSFPTPVYLSSGQAAAGATPDGVAVAPAGAIVFDALGRTNLGTDQSITVGTHTLTVEARSGLVTGP